MKTSSVEGALAEAVRLASAAGQWDVVRLLAGELHARRVARTPGVTSLDEERGRREREKGST